MDNIALLDFLSYTVFISTAMLKYFLEVTFMPGFRCPYCSMTMSVNSSTKSVQTPSFKFNYNNYPYDESCIEIVFFHCPNCNQYTILANGAGSAVKDIGTINIRPISQAKMFPDYIPLAIRQDYTEACAIVYLSPKASATLSRRCLQGMIRDFWNIQESNLSKAISQLEGLIPAQQWTVINGLRRLGNIGAHMEKDINLIVDIDPCEAQKLIKLIEHLLEQWYINRHEQELLYSDIIEIDKTKQNDRKRTE